MAKKESPGRDARGVRINNYSETTNGRLKTKTSTPSEQKVLLETFRRGFFGVERVEDENGNIIEVQKHPGGRPRKYETIEEFIEAVQSYVNYIDEVREGEGVELIPDVEGLCCYIGISRDTLFEWERSRGPEFSDVISRVRTAIASYKKQLGFNGKIPAVVMAIDFNNNHGYVQSQTIDIKASHKLEGLPSAEDISRKLPKKDAKLLTADQDINDLL